MAKIAISGDLHGMPFSKKKFESQRRSFFELFLVFLAKFFGKKRSDVIRISFFLMRNKINRVILCGDMQENTFNERGLTSEEDVSALQESIATLKSGSQARVEMTAGNHELGYGHLPLTSDPLGGISEKSVQNFLKVAERDKLFHSFLFGGKRFILVPYLFVEKDKKDWLKNLENEFAEQFRKVIENSQEQVIIIAHDFDSLRNHRLEMPIRSFLRTGKIEKIFCGHNHARWQFVVDQNLIKMFCSLWLMPIFLVTIPFAMLGGYLFHGDFMLFEKIRKYYVSRKPILRLAKIFNPITIPAPDGAFGIGGGILVYDTETGEVSIEKI